MDRGKRNHGTCLTSAVGLSCGALGDGGTCPGWEGLNRYLWKLLDAGGMCGVKPLQRRDGFWVSRKFSPCLPWGEQDLESW